MRDVDAALMEQVLDLLIFPSGDRPARTVMATGRINAKQGSKLHCAA
jgi:hypothetical protein